MSEIREKLAEFLAEENQSAGKNCRDPKTFIKKITTDKEYRLSECRKWADAILAKFEVAEKKPRYDVWCDAIPDAYLYRVVESGQPFARFANMEKAAEYANWLNSKENK